MNPNLFLEQMSLEEKVGQMFMLAFAGRRIKEACFLIQELGVGACYISQDNAATPKEAVELSNKLQNYASLTRHSIPILMAVDQEGTWGVVVPYTATGPGNLALGAANRPHITRGMYEIYGKELKAMGYNTLLAPCVDVRYKFNVLTSAMRSFGQDPELVAIMAATGVEGAHAGGVICCIKHFPGLGAINGDSHRDLPTLKHTRAEIESIDLIPFIAGINSGVDMVMTAHILCPSLDPYNPATVSRTILQDILRKQLSFEGVILSDSLNMGAIRKHFEPGDIAVRAVEAGVDMIMLAEEHYDHDSTNYLKKQSHSISSVIKAVENGRIPIERIDASVERILSLKVKCGLFEEKPASIDKVEIVGCDGHRQFEVDASANAITIIKGGDSHIPLPLDKQIVVVNTIPSERYEILGHCRGIGPNQTVPVFKTFADHLHSKRDDIEVVSYEDIVKGRFISFKLTEADLIIVVTEDYHLPAVKFAAGEQIESVDRLVNEYHNKIMVVAFRDPFDFRRLSNVDTYVCAFSSRPCAAIAMVDVLIGNKKAEGNLPISM